MISYIIRPVGIHDQSLLWCWRNDPVTREMERIPGIIPPDVYAAWIARMLENNSYRVLMAESDVAAIGVAFIYAPPEGSAEIGICLNPAFRGLGLSQGLLEAFVESARAELGFKRIFAAVRAKNIPSRRLFSSAGYKMDAITHDIVYFSRDMSAENTGVPTAKSSNRHHFTA
jgi:RimJ/RimL family protein N-acetyltransferase